MSTTASALQEGLCQATVTARTAFKKGWLEFKNMDECTEMAEAALCKCGYSKTASVIAAEEAITSEWIGSLEDDGEEC